MEMKFAINFPITGVVFIYDLMSGPDDGNDDDCLRMKCDSL